MRLDCSAFRSIKPVGSVDDYISGEDGQNSPKVRSNNSKIKILDALNDGAMSVKQLISKTGCSIAGTHGMMNRLQAKGLVSFVRVKVPGVQKRVSFYSLVES